MAGVATASDTTDTTTVAVELRRHSALQDLIARALIPLAPRLVAIAAALAADGEEATDDGISGETVAE